MLRTARQLNMQFIFRVMEELFNVVQFFCGLLEAFYYLLPRSL